MVVAAKAAEAAVEEAAEAAKAAEESGGSGNGGQLNGGGRRMRHRLGEVMGVGGARGICPYVAMVRVWCDCVV